MKLQDKKIVVTGGAGFLGGFVIAELKRRGVPENHIFVPRSNEYDLREKVMCREVVAEKDIVIHLAANAGGIGYNQKYPAQIYYDNTAMALNLIDESYKAHVQKFVGIGSVCAYPKFAPIPFKEEDLWSGYPEETNAPYGLAKRGMLTQTIAYNAQYGFCGIHLLLINLYGPGDDFDENSSHVIPALIKKIAKAQKDGERFIDVWGTGNATREFLYVEDAACAIVSATEFYTDPVPINVGAGYEISIKELVETLCSVMGFDGEIRWDTSKPDGQPRRGLSTEKAKIAFNFEARTSLLEGLRTTVKWYTNLT